MKSVIRVALIVLISIYLGGCASGPKYSEVSESISQPSPDTARIYVYRTAVLGAAVQPEVRLDDAPVGKATPKGFFYLDVEPGSHKIATSTEVDRTLSLVLEKGQTRYVKLNISMGFFVGHVYPELVENEIGQEEIKSCSYTGTL